MHMDKLRIFLNSMPIDKQRDFAKKCGTTIGYLRKAISIGQNLSASTIIAIERESECRVTVSDLRPEFAKALKISGYRKTKNDLGCQCQPPDMNTS